MTIEETIIITILTDFTIITPFGTIHSFKIKKEKLII